jgi:hypothetical protein
VTKEKWTLQTMELEVYVNFDVWSRKVVLFFCVSMEMRRVANGPSIKMRMRGNFFGVNVSQAGS